MGMGGGEISAAWQGGGGRHSQSFVLQTVLDSKPPRLRDAGADGQTPPGQEHFCNGGAAGRSPLVVTHIWVSLWLMQPKEMH